MGIILYRVKPASKNILCQSLSSGSLPVVNVIMHISIESWASSICWDGDPITVSIIITLPPSSLLVIACLHCVKILTQSSSLQSCSTNCHPQPKYKIRSIHHFFFCSGGMVRGIEEKQPMNYYIFLSEDTSHLTQTLDVQVRMCCRW